jgi:hypothetical protein
LPLNSKPSLLQTKLKGGSNRYLHINRI